MRIIAKKVKVKHLKAGDLFSVFGQPFWDGYMHVTDEEGNAPIGQRVFIRTEAPAPVEERENDIFRIKIKDK